MQLDLPLLKAIRQDVAIVSHRPAYAALQLFHSPSDSYPVQAHETVPLDDETVKVLESLDSSSFFFFFSFSCPVSLLAPFLLLDDLGAVAGISVRLLIFQLLD